MSSYCTVVLDFPPNMNNAYRPVTYIHNGKPRQRVALTDEAQAWKQEAILKLRPCRPDWLPPGMDTPEGKYAWSHVPHKRLRLYFAYCWLMPDLNTGNDLDGGHKFTQDAVADAWGFNDKRIDWYVAGRSAWPATSSATERRTTLTIYLGDVQDRWPTAEELLTEARWASATALQDS